MILIEEDIDQQSAAKSEYQYLPLYLKTKAKPSRAEAAEEEEEEEEEEVVILWGAAAVVMKVRPVVMHLLFR